MKIWTFDSIKDMEFGHIADKLNQLELDRDNALILLQSVINERGMRKNNLDEQYGGPLLSEKVIDTRSLIELGSNPSPAQISKDEEPEPRDIPSTARRMGFTTEEQWGGFLSAQQ